MQPDDLISDGPLILISKAEMGRGYIPAPGQIVRHYDTRGNPSGIFKMLCPYCGVEFHFENENNGPEEAPTMVRPITCTCRTRCAKTFRVRSGQVHPEEKPSRMEVEIPKRLREAGVHKAPVLNIKGD